MFWNSGMVTGGYLLGNNNDFHVMRVSPVSVIPLWLLSVTSFTASYILLVKMKCFGVI